MDHKRLSRDGPEHNSPGSSNDSVHTVNPARAAGHERIPARAATATAAAAQGPVTGPYPNGYHFPPSRSWKEGFVLGCKAFWNFTCTPMGFFIVLYGCLVVAWGGKLFLLLVNAAPAMCNPSCNDIDSSRRIWIEIDSQIVNALFCVTGFGLAPWRFRDLYFLLRWRIGKDHQAIRRLAGWHNSWFRLPGSQNLPVDMNRDNVNHLILAKQLPDVPYPDKRIPDPPLTGVRAPPTPGWKMDFVIWFNVSNTFLQCCLSGFMWGMNRYNRPPWAVGLFVALACTAAATGGLMMFYEGKKVKKIEGVPVTEDDLERLARDKELGITHYNNIKDKKPVDEEEKKQREANSAKRWKFWKREKADTLETV